MKNSKMHYVVTAIGIALLAIGMYMIKAIAEPEGILRTLPYICLGIGSGMFGDGMGRIISQKAVKKSPEIQKQIEIEKNDERNIAISNRAKGKAFDMMTFLFGALMMSFALMNVDIAATLLLAFGYLFVEGYAIYYRIKYEKEM